MLRIPRSGIEPDYPEANLICDVTLLNRNLHLEIPTSSRFYHPL